ncbi:hypothetical protein IC575_029782 [Cucumis melo]
MKKKSAVNILLCIVLLVGLESNKYSCLAQSSKVQLPFSEWKVTITNNIADSNLVVHCKSKDNDLGKQVIKQGGKYSWTFKENLWSTTLFWCNFKSKYGEVSGEVFWPENGSRLTDQCVKNNCVWFVQVGGVFLYSHHPSKVYHTKYTWK